MGIFGTISILILWIGTLYVTHGYINSVIGWIYFFWKCWATIHFILMIKNVKSHIALTGALTCIAIIFWTMQMGLYNPLHGMSISEFLVAAIAVSILNSLLITDAFAMYDWGEEKETEEETAESEAPAQDQ